MSNETAVGKSIPRVDALAKVTGKAMYCADFKIPNVLYAKILRSPHAHAKIVSIDTSRAEKLPGVRAVVTGKDAPNRRVGERLFDQYILAKDNVVRCIGQPVAAVAAETVDIAEDALELIDVKYEELPAVFDVELAAQQHPPVVIHPDLAQYNADPAFKKRIHPQEEPNVCYHHKIRKGDVEKAFAEADYVVENRYSTPRVSHCQLETHRTDAWVDSDGTLTVRVSSQGVSPVPQTLSQLFDLPQNKVRALASYVGGAFGGKSQATTVEPIAALLAMKTGRPVRLTLTREEHFVDGRHRAAFVIYIKDGVKKDGTLIAREMKVFLDMGRHVDSAHPVPRNCAFGAVGTYSVPNFKLDNLGVYTNNPVTSQYRGLGTPDLNWAVEQQMDVLARKIGMDPVEFRRKNLLKEGERDVTGMVTRGIGVEECLDKVAEWIKPDKKAEGQYPWKIGKGIAIGNKYTMSPSTSIAMVKMYPDGTIEVRHGNQDMGQGLNTMVAQIAAEEFKVGVDRVKVVWGDTTFCPYDYMAISQRATFHTGNAVLRACQDAKRRLFEITAGKLGVSADTLEVGGGTVYVKGQADKPIPISQLFSKERIASKDDEILGRGFFHCPLIPEDIETGQSERPVAYYAYCAHAVEVAVNVETGEVKLLRAVGAFDLGKAINPKLAEAQVDSGFSHGLGDVLTEQIVLDRGVVVNPTFMDYKMLSAAELPKNEAVKVFLVEVPHPEGPYGAKGVAEGAIVTIAPAIANAVYNATGVRLCEEPLTREKVLQAIKASEKVVAAR